MRLKTLLPAILVMLSALCAAQFSPNQIVFRDTSGSGSTVSVSEIPVGGGSYQWLDTASVQWSEAQVTVPSSGSIALGYGVSQYKPDGTHFLAITPNFGYTAIIRVISGSVSINLSGTTDGSAGAGSGVITSKPTPATSAPINLATGAVWSFNGTTGDWKSLIGGGGTGSSVTVTNFPTNSDLTAAISFTGANQSAQVAMAGYYGAGFSLTGTWVGTVAAQWSPDNGTTWSTVPVINTSVNPPVSSLSATADGAYTVVVPGGSGLVKITDTAWTSGTIGGTLRATIAQQNNYHYVVGSALPTNAAQETGGNLATIATNTGNGATSANQTNGNQQAKITDGTNIAKVLAGDQNGVSTAAISRTTTLTLTGAQSSGAALTDTNGGLGYLDLGQYGSCSIVLTSLGTGVTSVAFQGSNDGTNWYSANGLDEASTNAGSITSLSSTGHDALLESAWRYIRVTLGAAETAGTTSVAVIERSTAASMSHMLVAAAPTSPLVISPYVTITGGTTNVAQFSALTATAQAIKASSGNVYEYNIYNPNTSAVVVEMFNVAAASVVLGTTTPFWHITIPAGQTGHLARTFPLTFGTAISIAAVTTYNGSTAPTTAVDASVNWN